MSIMIGALAIGIGTWLGASTLSPIVVGLVLGIWWPRRAARVAALAAGLAWGGLLLLANARGAAIASLSSSLGAAMELPGWALVLATLCYPAVLASSAAWLGHLVSPRSSILTGGRGLPSGGPLHP